MPETLIGISASSYFLGFVLGCLFSSRVIAKVGHIRCFAVLTAATASAVLCLDMLDHWAPWLALRLLTGIAMSGLYTVIESWINSRATPSNRGRVLSIYTFITLAAMAIGQILINVGAIESSTPFTLAALFLTLAIVPIGLTSKMAPVLLSRILPISVYFTGAHSQRLRELSCLAWSQGVFGPWVLCFPATIVSLRSTSHGL